MLSGSATPAPSASPSAPPTPANVTCGSCGWATTLEPPELYLPANPDGTRSPLLFALKCPSRLAVAPICRRVRVFSSLNVPGVGPAVGEIPPILQTYPFIGDMDRAGGAAKQVARFLTFACDLYMVGRLEADPLARDAAYVGAALQMRKAAEVFLARCTMRVTGPIPKVHQMILTIDSEIPPTIYTRRERRKVRHNMRYVFDTGDIQSHPDPGSPALRNKRHRRPATRGTIESCLIRFEEAARLVAWDL